MWWRDVLLIAFGVIVGFGIGLFCCCCKTIRPGDHLLPPLK